MKTVTFEDLVGEHILDAVDYGSEEKHYDEDATIIRFRLDGIVYIAIENPDDGYRSYLGNLYVQEGGNVGNTFPPVKVTCSIDANTDNDIMRLTLENGETVLEVGTNYSDDYYPCFVGWFNVEAIN